MSGSRLTQPEDNTSQSLHDSNATQSPSLWFAVYDPNLTLEDALKMGYTRMNLISANGDNAINLGLTYRQAVNYPPAYDYGVAFSICIIFLFPCPSSSPHSLVSALRLPLCEQPQNSKRRCRTDRDIKYRHYAFYEPEPEHSLRHF